MPVNDESLLQTSALHTWIGIVAADKAPNSIAISVIIQELTPAVTGTVGVATATQAIQLSDINGNSINSSVTTGNTITAYYTGGDTNRNYPPDVVKGEQVVITKFANADKYYWDSRGRDDSLRMTETYRIGITNRKNFSDLDDDEHAYHFEMDTKRGKHIRLQTSKGNGEVFAYQLTLNAAASTVTLADDGGNSFTIDSANAKIIARNTKNAFFMLNGEDIVIGAPRDLTIKAGRQMLLDSPLMTMNISSGSGVLQVLANSIAVAASSAITMLSPSIGLNGAVQIPTILTANNIRARVYANGSPGTTYPSASIALSTATPTNPTVTPDTTMPSSQRHAASWEQVTEALLNITRCFNAVQGVIGAPVEQTALADIAVQSKMNYLQGT